MIDYTAFLEGKVHKGALHGFEPLLMPDKLFGFQQALLEWAVRKGRAAVFADCGLGKSPMQLLWSENVVRKTGKPVLLLTPLAVAPQTVREGAKFGVEAFHSRDGKVPTGARVIVANYQRLHLFTPDDFAGVACDESSILKNFDGATRNEVIDFVRKVAYRSLWTATAAPNDYIELGNSSEALGELGFSDMLSKFFKKNTSTRTRADEFRSGVWRFRGHAERDFWRWVCSWARAARKPSDLGFEDNGFKLPALKTVEHVVRASTRADGFLFDLPAMNLHEQRAERRRTIRERCEAAAELVVNGKHGSAVCWCHLNDEGDLLAKLIPGAVQVSGDDQDELKEEQFEAFQKGQVRVMVTKPVIGGLGLNWQHCAHQTTFPSHSFEQWYQCVRRSWRFGQKREVRIDMITSEGEVGVLANLNRKAEAADRMFDQLVAFMDNELKLKGTNTMTKREQVPSWL